MTALSCPRCSAARCGAPDTQGNDTRENPALTPAEYVERKGHTAETPRAQNTRGTESTKAAPIEPWRRLRAQLRSGSEAPRRPAGWRASFARHEKRRQPRGTHRGSATARVLEGEHAPRPRTTAGSIGRRVCSGTSDRSPTIGAALEQSRPHQDAAAFRSPGRTLSLAGLALGSAGADELGVHDLARKARSGTGALGGVVPMRAAIGAKALESIEPTAAL